MSEPTPRTVTVHRASNVTSDTPVTSCTIVIGKTLAEDGQADVSLNQLSLIFSAEADIIAEALFNHLPQGVCHRVMARMLDHYAKRNSSPLRF